MSLWLIGIAIAAYFFLIFQLAHWADQRAARPMRAWMYTLSLAVYCTSWTFYGGVGRSAEIGIGFFSVYIGPIAVFLFAQPLLRKLLRVSKAQHITSISDFLAARYGKSGPLGAMVAAVALLSVVPYIGLQLKAVSDSVQVIANYPHHQANLDGLPFWVDPSFWIAIALSLFVIGFGTRHTDASEQHRGMISVVALESVVKLVAFVLTAMVIVMGMGGPSVLAQRMLEHQALAPVISMAQLSKLDFWLQCVLSGLVILCLPRQFHVMVVENTEPTHLRTSRWLFPLYLVAINLFVLPLALAGLLTFAPGSYKPDTFILALPLAQGQQALALLVFIGGLSAATAMIIVETITLATMTSNDLVLPWLIRRHFKRHRVPRDVARLLKPVRRGAILLLVILSYCFVRLIGHAYSLASIGLMSFVAVAQFAPALIGGLYWHRGHRYGAAAGLGCGFLIWLYTLLIPSFAQSHWIDSRYLTDGPFGIHWLRPYALLGSDGLVGPVVHSMLFSLLVNILVYVLVSYCSRVKARDVQQADIFVLEQHTVRATSFTGSVTMKQLMDELAYFIGPDRLQADRRLLEKQRGGPLDELAAPDAAVQHWAETQLAGALGAAMARVVLSATLKSLDVDKQTALNMLSAASQAIHSNWESLRTTLDNVSQGVCMFDAEFKLTVWNRRVFELLDIPLEQACIGTGIAAFVRHRSQCGEFGCDPTQVAIMEAACARELLLSRAPQNGISNLPNGLIVEWQWRPLLKGGLVGTFTDITVQKQAESMLEQKVAERTSEVLMQKQEVEREHEQVILAHRNISLLSEIGREITATLDSEIIMQSVYRHVHELMQVDTFAVSLMDEERGVIEFPFVIKGGQRSQWTASGSAWAHHFATWCIAQRSAVFINDLPHEYAKYRLADTGSHEAEREFVGPVAPKAWDGPSVEGEPGMPMSLIYVPLVVKNRVLGTLSVHSAQPNGYESVHLNMLLTLAAYSSVALDNADAYRQLKSLQEKLIAQEKMAALGYLVGGIAHELNTPLGNSLLTASALSQMSAGFMAQIESGAIRRADLIAFGEETAEACGLVVHNLERAADLVSSFKQLAVSQEGAQRHRYNLQHASLDVVASKISTIHAQGHGIELDIPDNIDMDSYPLPYGELITQLIDNALLHGFAGRSGGQMRLTARQAASGQVRIQFSDNGVGVAEENLKRIFDPFFTTKLGSGKNGLGLHIVYNLVTALLGGQISVQSAPGGTTFIIDLPLMARA
jgi:Na+/proline symporter/signal transduction histidine kinase